MTHPRVAVVVLTLALSALAGWLVGTRASGAALPDAPAMRGAAAPYELALDCADLGRVGASWWYDWGLAAKGCDETGAEFVPMVWGAVTEAPVITDTSSVWLLGFNEPNWAGQAVMTPADAVGMWAYLEATGRELVSPAVSACEAGPGGGCLDAAWLEQFMALCAAREPAPCRIDALALHWYGCDAGTFAAYLDMRHAEYPTLPVWVTEFGCPPQHGDLARFMVEALAQIVARPWVERASWFALYGAAGMPGLVEDGALTALGRIWAGRPQLWAPLVAGALGAYP